MNLNFVKEAAGLLAKGRAASGMQLFPAYEGPFALVHDDVLPDGQPGARRNVELCCAKAFKIVVGTSTYASLVLCRLEDDGTPAWAVYCGDAQLSGEQREDGKHLASLLRAVGAIHQIVLNNLESSPWVGAIPDQDSCTFFRMQSQFPGRVCRHVEHMLAAIDVKELEGMARVIADWHAGGPGNLSKVQRELSEEEKIALRVAFVKPVLLAGERGSGKTYLARQLADDLDAVYLEMQMHPSMEPWEFRMHERFMNGKPVQVMGKLAEAVYWTQQGRRVLLCMDEFSNMNPVYQTVINSPLSRTKNNTYLIETGRVVEREDGVGVYEIVEVPCDLLWVVATSNVGARYGLDKVPPSVRARFRVILMNSSAERTKSIVESQLKTLGMPTDFAAMFQKFISACNKGVQENTLDEEATTRLACDVIYAAHAQATREKRELHTKAAWLPEITLHLLDEIAQVVNFELGPLDPDQKAKYIALVGACFK